MSEERRIISEYKPRLKIPTSTLASETGYALYCLPKAGASMLNRILGYLVREVTYIDQSINDQVYYGPTVEQLELATDLAGEIGASLVSECDFSDIIEQLEEMNLSFAEISACVCALQAQAAQGTSLALYEAGERYAPSFGNELGIANRSVPSDDQEKCDLANVIWGFQRQWIQESLLPFLSSAVDATSIAIGATTAFALASGGLGLPIAAATALLSVITNMLVDTSVENLIQWMISNAQEMVCHLYNGLVGEGYTEAALLAQLHIDQSGLPLGDRMMLKLTLTAEFYMQSIDKSIYDGNLNPLDYDDYLCTGCSDYEYTYFYDGDACPVGGLVGTDCSSGYPHVYVANSAQTDDPPLILTAPSVTTYRAYIRAEPMGGIGGTFTIALHKGTDHIVVDSDTIVLPTSGGPVTYQVDLAAYAPTGTYIAITPVGASSGKFYWVGVDLI